MPTCFMDLPVELVRIMLVSVNTWTKAEDDRVCLRWWNSMKLCCTWLHAVCKSYEPQVFKAAQVTRRASLILTPHDEPMYNYHEMMPYCKMDHRREQQTLKPGTALLQDAAPGRARATPSFAVRVAAGQGPALLLQPSATLTSAASCSQRC